MLFPKINHMKKVILSIAIVIFSICAAFAVSIAQEGHYLYNPGTHQFDRSESAPHQEIIAARCPGFLYDCYYTLDETGSIKTGIAFRDF